MLYILNELSGSTFVSQRKKPEQIHIQVTTHQKTVRILSRAVNRFLMYLGFSWIGSHQLMTRQGNTHWSETQLLALYVNVMLINYTRLAELDAEVVQAGAA